MEQNSRVAGIRFKRAGEISYYDPAQEELNWDDYVVAETPEGSNVGWVVIPSQPIIEKQLQEPLKPILRKASVADLQRWNELKEKAEEALAKCKEMVASHNLPMKLVSAEYNLDGDYLTIYFTSEERVDFRQLVKEVKDTLKVRSELRQIGPRDETKMIGGIGRCGMVLCCICWLARFSNVGIKMAKVQNLPLSPPNLSGACSKLKCCLRFEHEQYVAMNAKLPRIGEKVGTPMGIATVVVGHPLKDSVTVRLESQAWVELPLEQIQRLQAKGAPTS